MNSEINAEQDENVKKQPLHHKQLELCMTRPAYRQGREFTAVKVYSISSESQHLFIYGVPTINLRSELKSLLNKYGEIISIHVVPQQEVEIFTECYHVHYQRIQSARIAKRLVDTKSFYGGVLHVCYAPEYETLEETSAKLLQRKKDVLVRLNKYNAELYEKQPEVKVQIKDESNKQNISGKRHQFENEVAPIYSESDPILSHKKKQKKNFEENIAKYASQFSDMNGGLNNRNSNLFKIHSKKFVPLPLRYKTISGDQVYGPQFPKSITTSIGNSEKLNAVPISEDQVYGPQFPKSITTSIGNSEKLNAVPSEDNVKEISDSLENGRLNIRKISNNVEKRIIFRNKIQDKIS